MKTEVLSIRFEEMAELYPKHIAIKDEGVAISYVDLNCQANKIAHLLVDLFEERNSIVATFMPTSSSLIACLLAVFKSNGIYVPLNPNSTIKSIKQIFTETAPTVVFTNEKLAFTLENILYELEVSVKYIVILTANESISVYSRDVSTKSLTGCTIDQLSGENLDLAIDPNSGNYIVYTSGTTGIGKPILGCHKSLHHFIQWEIKEFALDQRIKVSQLAQITFDASFRDIFVPLCTGGTLCIPPANIRSNIPKLINWLEEEVITLIHCVPSVFRLISRELENAGLNRSRLPQLAYILMAGEPLYAKDVKKWMSNVGKHVELVNLYGTSETTMAKTFYRVKDVPEDPARIIPAGRPITETAVAIINANYICRVGEIGEIYIKSPYVTKGYYNSPELTTKVFVQNPLVEDRTDLVHKTGDLGRYLEDKNIEVLGRIDDQVKVNGIRVELSAVEQAVLKLQGIDQTVITSHKDESDEVRLICYYVGKVSEAELRAHLTEQLDPSIAPGYFIQLSELPLTLNGKVEKKELPIPKDLLNKQFECDPVQNEIEARLEKIWKQVLGREAIGRSDSFFKIGGSSLKAIQVISRIYKEFSVSIIIADMFVHQSIEKLAKLIEGATINTFKAIDPIQKQTHYEVSYAQKRLWILDQVEKDPTSYSMFFAYKLHGVLLDQVLPMVLNTLIERHESLRTTFINQDGEPKQKVHPFNGSQDYVQWIDLRSLPLLNQDESVHEIVESEAARVFNLEEGPLFRSKVIQLALNELVLVINMHHIISDGWSINIFYNELFTLLEAFSEGRPNPLQPLKIQYKDYVVWQRNQLLLGGYRMHQAYWLKQFEDGIPELNIPFRKESVNASLNTNSRVTLVLHKEIKAGLSELASIEDATMFMVVFTIFTIMLYQYSAQTDIVLGMPVAERDHIDLEQQIGLYVNTLALRVKFNQEDTFYNLLRKVKGVIIKSREHQQYPFDKLVEDLNIKRSPGKHPLFNIILNMINRDMTKDTAGTPIEEKFTASRIEIEHHKSKFDLLINFSENDMLNAVEVIFDYSVSCFEHKDIVKMGQHFKKLAESVINHPQVVIKDLTLFEDLKFPAIQPISR